MRVLIVGATDKTDRFAYLAKTALYANGHEAIGLHPRLKFVEEMPVVARFDEISEPIDTVTIYVGKDRSSLMTNDIIRLAPKRVIFNPGAENPKLAGQLRAVGIRTLDACTLVLLRTGQFNRKLDFL